jgi:hypothetical protein
MHIFQSY